MSELLQLIKQAAAQQNEAGKPMELMFGNVSKAEPLEINIDQKLTLTQPFLILTKNVSNYEVEMEVSHVTENTYTGNTNHSHAYLGKKKFKVLNGLRIGDKVMLLRANGGQKFIVLERIEV